MKRTGNILILLLITIIATSCDGGDRDRIPAAAVRVEFANQAMWDQYGVSGKFHTPPVHFNQKIPAGFPALPHPRPQDTEGSCLLLTNTVCPTSTTSVVP
ncbi:MAG: hypothetical protein V8Q80_09000 [Barnesiella intestinihominis]